MSIGCWRCPGLSASYGLPDGACASHRATCLALCVWLTLQWLLVRARRGVESYPWVCIFFSFFVGVGCASQLAQKVCPVCTPAVGNFNLLPALHVASSSCPAPPPHPCHTLASFFVSAPPTLLPQAGIESLWRSAIRSNMKVNLHDVKTFDIFPLRELLRSWDDLKPLLSRPASAPAPPHGGAQPRTRRPSPRPPLPLPPRVARGSPRAPASPSRLVGEGRRMRDR